MAYQEQASVHIAASAEAVFAFVDDLVAVLAT